MNSIDGNKLDKVVKIIVLCILVLIVVWGYSKKLGENTMCFMENEINEYMIRFKIEK
jgi:hypothetical protein